MQPQTKSLPFIMLIARPNVHNTSSPEMFTFEAFTLLKCNRFGFCELEIHSHSFSVIRISVLHRPDKEKKNTYSDTFRRYSWRKWVTKPRAPLLGKRSFTSSINGAIVVNVCSCWRVFNKPQDFWRHSRERRLSYRFILGQFHNHITQVSKDILKTIVRLIKVLDSMFHDVFIWEAHFPVIENNRVQITVCCCKFWPLSSNSMILWVEKFIIQAYEVVYVD